MAQAAQNVLPVAKSFEKNSENDRERIKIGPPKVVWSGQ